MKVLGRWYSLLSLPLPYLLMKNFTAPGKGNTQRERERETSGSGKKAKNKDIKVR
jgi:hypothetical protein